jgi:hypothetical protein
MSFAGEKFSLEFIKNVRGPKGRVRTNCWAVKPSGDFLADCRKGREFALAYMAQECARGASETDGAPLIEKIVADIVASRDHSGLVVGFFSTIVGCSSAEWQPSAIERFRRQYEDIDREVDERLAALHRAQTRQPSRARPGDGDGRVPAP